jgi:hypothetical protein
MLPRLLVTELLALDTELELGDTLLIDDELKAIEELLIDERLELKLTALLTATLDELIIITTTELLELDTELLERNTELLELDFEELITELFTEELLDNCILDEASELD